MFDWIPWTTPVAIVFIGVALMITGLTIWGHYRPPVRRKGFLGIVTDRTERVYIAIVSFALIMVVSFAVVDSDTVTWANISASHGSGDPNMGVKNSVSKLCSSFWSAGIPRVLEMLRRPNRPPQRQCER